MARANNPLLDGVRGKMGPLVIRQVGGQTIVSAGEGPGRRAPRSPAQQAHLDRMYRAQLYAKDQLRDPTSKTRYAARVDTRRTSAYTVAIADYMNAPQVSAVDSACYRGQTGDPIRVLATDDFEVIAVHVLVRSADGAVVEQGDAVWQADDIWLYLATQTHPVGPGTRIEVEARDRPGNTAAQVALM